MLRCPHCGWPAGRSESCPRCHKPNLPEPLNDACTSIIERTVESGEWTVVARFGNAAEAGYFANELEYAVGCEPRLEHRDDFDPVHHFWRTSYVLSVPDSLAEVACAQLKRILDGEPVEPVGEPTVGTKPRRNFDSGQGRSDSGVEPARDLSVASLESGINWVPIVLTLAAGSLVLWAGKKVHVPRRAPAPDDAMRVDVWEALGRDRAPWVQHTDDQRVVRELRIDAATGQAIVREDADGDGVFETEAQYATRDN